MSQSLSKIYIHAIFSTKNREPLLHDAWRSELFGIVGGAANLSGCQSLVVGGVADHLHTLFVLPRSTCVSDALRGIKSASSNWISTLNSRLHIIRGIPSRMNCVNCFAAMALRGTKNMFGIDALTKRPPCDSGL